MTVLPEECNVKVDMIPKYCYYKKANKYYGYGFCIDEKHHKMNGLA